MIVILMSFFCCKKPATDKTQIDRPNDTESMLQTFTSSVSSNSDGYLSVDIPLNEGDSALMITGISNRYMALEEIRAADGTLLFDWYDWYDSDYSLTDSIFAIEKDVAVQWPIRGVDPVLSGEALNVVLSTLNSNGYYQGNQDVDLIFQVKADEDFSKGKVRVAIAYAADLGSDNSLVSAVESSVEAWKLIWGDVGLVLEERYVNIDLSADVPVPSESAQLLSASNEIGEDDDLLMVIGDSIQGEWGTLGISGGIPGPLINSERGAVMISWLENAGVDGQFSTQDIQMMGETMAHEVGHYMGLYHPVESEYNYWDALEDTPDCTNWNSCENQLGENLMFPYPICYGECVAQTELSLEQQGVLQRFTGTL